MQCVVNESEMYCFSTIIKTYCVPFQTDDEAAKTDETNGTMEDLIMGGEGLPTYGTVMYVDYICIGVVSIRFYYSANSVSKRK